MMLFRTHGGGESFSQLVERCLAAPGVTWTHTRACSTADPLEAAQQMAAAVAVAPRRTAQAIRPARRAPFPAFHYTLSSNHPAHIRACRRAVTESLTALGLDEHQAVLVGRGGPAPQVDVIVNRLSPRDGSAVPVATLALNLLRWHQRRQRQRGVLAFPHPSSLPPDDPPPGAA